VLGIARDLNNRKVPPPSPRITGWTGMAVRGLVKRERNIGKRVHHGEVVGNGNWDAILDEEVFVQVRAILGDPKRRTSPGNQPRHLLSLIARCGVCGSHMAAAMNRRPVYRCKGRGCASRRIDVMDAHVEEVVLQWFASGEAQELLAAQGDDRSMEALQRAQALRLELDALADDFYVHKVIDREQFVRISVGKRRELERAQEQASQVLGRPVWADLVRQDPAHRAHLWKEMPLGRKRSVLAELFEITVHRSKLGRGVWDPESVEIRQRNDVEPTEG